MTYCVGVLLDAGLVLASDSRTNAGVDQIGTFRKMAIYGRPGDRVIVLLSSGNLAVTQAVASLLEQKGKESQESLWTVSSLYKAADLVGETLREVQNRDGPHLKQHNIDGSAGFILGGQIRGEKPRLFNIYTEGNFIEATPDTPYFQIGELKYGKPILDRVVTTRTTLTEAAKCVLVSFDSTMRSNISVGLPVDLLCYERDSLKEGVHRRFTEKDPYFDLIRKQWQDGLRRVLGELPDPTGKDETMSIRVALKHKTHYRFDRPVNLSPHEVRLRPAPHCATSIRSYSMKISPADHFINWQQDPYGNYLARLVFPEKATELSITVDLVADMTVINPFDFFVEPYAEKFPFAYSSQLAKELKPFLEYEPAGRLLDGWIATFKTWWSFQDKSTIDMIVALNRRVQEGIEYVLRLDPGVQTCEETLKRRRGSCRDSAWLLVQILRGLGLAARFASGYLIQLAPDVKPLEGPAGPSKDFTDLHAWTEVYMPGAGWIGLDPTSGLLAGEGHIPLACTANPISAAPIIGATDECESKLEFDMTVTRVHEDPRVTRPYSEVQWSEIDALGARVDDELKSADVRLTMGGEPTFVSSDDMDGEEWNIAALGQSKLKLAGDLLKRLKERFAPGGLLHHGQGKWYPGEPLPRWALSCYWRVDGKPVWNDPGLSADITADYGFGASDAEKFLKGIAEHLGISPAFALPAYEDPWHYVMEEERLPVNVDPFQKDLKDPKERSTLARRLDRGLAEVAAYVLPIKAEHQNEMRWLSSSWPLRRNNLFLLPGDSPAGFRLPLNSLPWIPPDRAGVEYGRDPLEPRQSLPYPLIKRSENIRADRRPALPDKQAADEIIRTAVCVEPREGRLYVFMPPVPYLEDYLALVSAIEATARELRMPALIEGYPPPYDYRLNVLKVTPDPGVIEVNIHPARSWPELVANTTTLYEEARLTRLSTEKFMLDGRHTGTGGGNHITIGGPAPADSPALRRPDLLKSLVLYWQNHPALSYLFSGLFVGPTSQAPRVDEARHDGLYELEIAFQQMAEKQAAGRVALTPWLVDRLFRNLLIDVTGNTHRAEFSIDKLYSPDGPAGRLGIVEFRAFEMPPHARMSLVQMLLLRALISRFWKTPYEGRLVHWGTGLHDRFMLSHYVSQDMRDMVLDLQRAGYPFKFDWFLPFLEFRFPRYGTVVCDGIELELRQAIEPWHVMGEEVSAGAAARFVDSSVERLQVKVRGRIGTRHLVTCNGRQVPLHPTGISGEYVAGVRYRAWLPPSALHPTIPIHSPLIFDIVDTWNGRSIGGCTYHVVHPGGRGYTVFPVNANEAEARRLTRFWNYGHTPGPMSIQPEEPNRDFPLTLDLRWNP